MQMSEVLTKISDHYVPGVIEFYERMSPNPWQANNDRVEGVMLLYTGDKDYFDKIEPAVKDFWEESIALIEKAKPFLISKKAISIVDALMIGSEEKLKEYEAANFDICADCGKKEGVRIVWKADDYGKFCVECVKP